MSEILVGIGTGVISSLLVSEFYRRIQANREKRLNFKHDQQMFSKYLGVIINELEIYEKTENSDHLIRSLNEPHLYYSFTEKNLSRDSLDIIANANGILDRLEYDLGKSEILTKGKLVKYRSELFRSELDILKMRVKEKNK